MASRKRARQKKASSPRGAQGPSPSVVERTADAIAYDIAVGKHPAGERLPSVRELATTFGINPSTMQVVLGRLQASGFVTANPRLGFVVRDVERLGGIPTWRYVFRFARQLPDRASKVCEDLLEMRRVLIGEAIQKIAEQPGRYDPSSVRRAVERLELVVSTRPSELSEIAAAELAATRALTFAVGQTVVTAVLNSIGEIYLDVPELIDAMYAEPKRHVAVWHSLLGSWERREFPASANVEVRKLLQHYDRTVVERFSKNLGARRTSGPADKRARR